MSYILSFKRKGTVTPPLSDLVALGILPKQISEFTNADIGTEISIPYTDAGGVISGPIIFEVVGVNHHTSDAYPQTITLMTKNIIRHAVFDAIEKGNPDFYRKSYGNNHWKCSNIRQWLNSSGAAGSWFTEKYENNEYDTSPTSDNVFNRYAVGAYADAPGFLAGFESEVLEHLTEITNITALHELDGGKSETTVDKVFLPSLTEMGFGSNGEIAEGSPLSKFTDDVSRRKQLNGVAGFYWMRSPYTGLIGDTRVPSYVRNVRDSGGTYQEHASNVSPYTPRGIAPIIVLH